MTIAVDRLQVARMVDFSRRPAALPRLGLADDVMHLVGRCEPQPSAQAVGALAQSVIPLQDGQPQLLPRPAVAALVAITALGVGTPARCGARLGLE